MKPWPIIVVFFAVAVPAPHAAAEPDAGRIDTLMVDLWPDYDQASVLVLLTGRLPGDMALPARVTLPLPGTARLNAVARIDARDGRMKDDILSSPGPGELAFITPDPSFRVEYYLPYTTKNKQRSFDFTWRSDVSVDRFMVKVQQPAAADTLRTEPAAPDVLRDENGFNYHFFPVQSLPAGTPYKLHVDYTMNQSKLSVSGLPPSVPAAPVAPVAVASKPASPTGINWPLLTLIAGGALIFLALIWMLVSRRSGRFS